MTKLEKEIEAAKRLIDQYTNYLNKSPPPPKDTIESFKWGIEDKEKELSALEKRQKKEVRYDLLVYLAVMVTLIAGISLI